MREPDAPVAVTSTEPAATVEARTVVAVETEAPGATAVWVLSPHAVAGTPGAEIVPDLAPRPGEAVVRKRRYSGFFETDLAGLLHGLGVDTLALCGLQTDCCVLHTAADGFFRGFGLVILEDAVAARTRDGHRRALKDARRLYGARVLPSDTFLTLALVHG